MNKLKITFVILLFVLFALGSGSSNVNKETNVKENISVKEEKKLPAVTETVIFKEKGISITAKEIVEDFWGQGLKLLIENNSDKDINVSADALAINGYMVSDLLYETVAAGSKTNTTVHCLSSELKEAGISDLGEIAIWINISDANNYNYIYKADTPSIIKTSLYEDMVTDLKVDGVEVVNQNGIKLIVKYVDENSFWGTSVLIYAENNSDKDVTVSSENIMVNGYSLNGFYHSAIKSGYKSFDNLTLFSSELKENDIEKIESIKMNFKYYNSDNFFDISKTDYVTIDVN